MLEQGINLPSTREASHPVSQGVTPREAYWQGFAGQEAVDVWAEHTAQTLNTRAAKKERKLLNQMLELRSSHRFTPKDMGLVLTRYGTAQSTEEAVTTHDPESGFERFSKDIVTVHNNYWADIRKNRKTIERLAGIFGEEAQGEIMNTLQEKVKSDPTPRFPRRKLLRGGMLLASAAVLTPLTEVLSSDETRTGIQAARRPSPATLDNQELAINIPSDSELTNMYTTFFGNEANAFPFELWIGEDRLGEWGVSTAISRLANLSYDREKLPGEQFDTYFVRWMSQWKKIADTVGMDWVVLITTMKVSGENITDLKNQKEDVTTTYIQTGAIPVLREFGLDLPFLHAIGPEGAIKQFRKQHGDEFHNNFEGASLQWPLPEEGIWAYDLLRFQSPTTTGYMDYESGERARAVISNMMKDKTGYQLLQEKYPAAAKVYEKLYVKWQERETAREELKRVSDEYVAAFGDRLTVFLQDSQEGKDARERIGIGENVDMWQLVNYTDGWLEQARTPLTSVSLSQRVLSSMREQYQEDPKQFALSFLSQQLLNDKFIHFMEENSMPLEEKVTWQRVVSGLRTYIDRSQQQRIANNETLIEENKYEYDSYYQQLTSTLVTKYLSEIVGSYDKNSLNSRYWHIYLLACIREMPPPRSLVHGTQFAKDAKTDEPYDRGEFLKRHEEFVELLKQLKIISKDPVEDMKSFSDAIAALRSRDISNLTYLSVKEWDNLVRTFDTYMITRCYLDIGYLDQFKNTSLNTELSNILIDTQVIKVPLEEDSREFLMVVNDFLSDRYYLYPGLSEENKQIVKEFIDTKILSQIKKVYYGGSMNFPIVWQEYPPIIRTKFVWQVFNLLNDLKKKSDDTSGK